MRSISRRNARAGRSGGADPPVTALSSLQNVTVCTPTELRVGAGSRAQACPGKVKVFTPRICSAWFTARYQAPDCIFQDSDSGSGSVRFRVQRW